MKIQIEPQRLKKTKWYEYLLRFAMGGLITAGAGYITKRCGPEVGGLFLAFPAILPAAATLLEKHEKSRKAAGLDSAGAAVGCLGLLAFAGIVWGFGSAHSGWVVIPGAAVAWLAVSVALWWAWRRATHARVTAGHPRPRPSRAEAGRAD
jgi:hypothetical protein